jgi:hypothetical protein
MRLAVLLLLLLALAGVAAAQDPKGAADASRFDGAWAGVISCPAHVEDTGARGYSYAFAARVKDGVFHAQHRNENAPGSLKIDGPIQPDGTADLIATGRTGNPDYAVKHLAPSTPYSYRIKAHFDGTRGTGTRLDSRRCDFTFTRE